MNDNKIEQDYISLALRVEDFPEDGRVKHRSEVWLTPEVMKYYNLTKDDCIEISNPNSDKKIILPCRIVYSKDDIDDKGIIYLDSNERQILDVSSNDIVYLNKPKEKFALAVNIAYFDGVKFLKNYKDLVYDFLTEKVSIGDILTTTKYNRDFKLKIIKLYPEVESARIFEHTIFRFEKVSPEDPIILSRLKQATELSNKVRLDRFKNFLDLDADAFIDKILEWEDNFNFKIEDKYLYFVKEDSSEFIKKLKIKFDEWEQNTFKISKIQEVNNSKQKQTESIRIEKASTEKELIRKYELLETLADLGDYDAGFNLQVKALSHWKPIKLQNVNKEHKIKDTYPKDIQYAKINKNGSQKTINHLNASLFAKRLFNLIVNHRKDPRKESHIILQQIMENGANGVEIIVRIAIEPYKCKEFIFRAGSLIKSEKSKSHRVESITYHSTKPYGKFKVIIKIEKAEKFKEILIRRKFLSNIYKIEEEESIQTSSQRFYGENHKII